MQAGVELIGSNSYMADLEMASMAIVVLKECNETNFSLELGDAGIFKELMRELHASPNTKEEIRHLIETKNYSTLNDLLDTLGDNHILHNSYYNNHFDIHNYNHIHFDNYYHNYMVADYIL